MSIDALPTRANLQVIDQTWFNILQTILSGDIVPRTTGIATDLGGNLGTSTFAFNQSCLTQLGLRSNGNVAGLIAPAALAASYNLTMPPGLPAVTSFMQVDTSGVITLTAGTVPAGSMLPYGGTSAPTGFLLCDGTSYLRTAQAALFAAIGTAYGTADGTHFNVPDLRGQFIRGKNGGTGTDPDAAGRTAIKTGGNTGDNVGSVQADQLKSHTHPIPANNDLGVASGASTSATTDSPFTSTATGGNETRPTNVYVNFIIKT